ncbi:MAG: PAS domain S-box protein [Anaerolineae bacterium]|jgi:PAS domain S-box-containing protein
MLYSLATGINEKSEHKMDVSNSPGAPVPDHDEGTETAGRAEPETQNHDQHLQDPVRERATDIRKLSRAVEHSPSTVVITDVQGTIEYVNPSFARLTGYALEEILGRNPRFLHSGRHDPSFYADMWTTILGGNEWRGEFVNRRKDGSLYWEWASIAPIQDETGAITHFIKVAEDITDRKHAEEALHRRVEELATLNRVAQTLATMTDLPSALQNVAETVTKILDASVTVISAFNADELEVIAWCEHEPLVSRITDPVFLANPDRPGVHEALARGKILVVPNVQAETRSPVHQDYLRAHRIQAVMLVPLQVRGTIVGLMEVGIDQPDRVSPPDQIRLTETIATNVAVAVENARLVEQAQSAAISAERQRLARDLHDAVTQTLYSAGLIAEALPRIWERSPQEARRSLIKLRQLTRGALAEMRTLLFELRPAALEEADLETLLRQLGDALSGRTRIPVSIAVEGSTDLPPEVKISLYRIAQEAFNNIAKHAGATHVSVALHRQPHEVTLRIADNGRGFDLAAVAPGRMGLGIMRERAHEIGASFRLHSLPGQGTEISVASPVQVMAHAT